MKGQSPVSLETLKLKLISNTSKYEPDPLLTKDGIKYLLKALTYADASFSDEIENALVKAGALAIPELIKSLGAESLNIRSVAAMALIRLGQDAEKALMQAYPRYAKKASVRWVFQFVFQELGLELPSINTEQFYPSATLEIAG